MHILLYIKEKLIDLLGFESLLVLEHQFVIYTLDLGHQIEICGFWHDTFMTGDIVARDN
jgi:hypothetical protein